MYIIASTIQDESGGYILVDIYHALVGFPQWRMTQLTSVSKSIPGHAYDAQHLRSSKVQPHLQVVVATRLKAVKHPMILSKLGQVN